MKGHSSVTSALLLCALFNALGLFAQSEVMGLRPGASTRAEVEDVLGAPVRQVSPTVVEYAPQRGTGKLEVEYRAGADVADRIEVHFLTPIAQAALAERLALTSPAQRQETNAQGNLVEYFEEPALALTYATADRTDGVSSIGYLSRDLFAPSTVAPSLAPQPKVAAVPDAPADRPSATTLSGHLVVSHSGSCLEIAGGEQRGLHNGASAHQWQCRAVRNQIWSLRADATGRWFELRAGHSDKCLDLDQQAPRSLQGGIPLHQWDCHGGDSQLFELIEVGGGAWQLKSKLAREKRRPPQWEEVGDGQCIDIVGSGKYDGMPAQVWDCHDAPNQRWVLKKGPA